MSKPIPVAITQTLRPDGRRLYTAINRDGGVVGKWSTIDCGHGAHLAYTAIREAGFVLSDAAWTNKVRRAHYAVATA